MTEHPLPDRAATPVTLYWRPGCGFCRALIGDIDEAGLELDRRNIWEDEAAAADVRSVADGNEVVPTVRIGEVALVNPSFEQLLAELGALAPERLPDA